MGARDGMQALLTGLGHGEVRWLSVRIRAFQFLVELYADGSFLKCLIYKDLGSFGRPTRKHHNLLRIPCNAEP